MQSIANNNNNNIDIVSSNWQVVNVNPIELFEDYESYCIRNDPLRVNVYLTERGTTDASVINDSLISTTSRDLVVEFKAAGIKNPETIMAELKLYLENAEEGSIDLVDTPFDVSIKPLQGKKKIRSEDPKFTLSVCNNKNGECVVCGALKFTFKKEINSYKNGNNKYKFFLKLSSTETNATLIQLLSQGFIVQTKLPKSKAKRAHDESAIADAGNNNREESFLQAKPSSNKKTKQSQSKPDETPIVDALEEQRAQLMAKCISLLPGLDVSQLEHLYQLLSTMATTTNTACAVVPQQQQQQQQQQQPEEQTQSPQIVYQEQAQQHHFFDVPNELNPSSLPLSMTETMMMMPILLDPKGYLSSSSIESLFDETM